MQTTAQSSDGSGGRPLTIARGLAAGLASFLLWLSFGEGLQGATALVALVPWLAGAWRLGTLAGATIGMAVGVAFGCLAGSWLPVALEAFGSGAIQAHAAFLATTVLVAGLPFGILGAVLGATRSLGAESRLALFTTTAFLIDHARSVGSPGIPWLLLGHSQAGLGLAQLAVVGGVPLVSALVASCNLVLAAAMTASFRQRQLSIPGCMPPVVGALVFASALGVPVASQLRGEPSASHPDAVEILIVQPNIPVGERWLSEVQRTNLGITARLSQRSLDGASARPDLILWPETLVTSPIDRDAELDADLRRSVRALGVPLLLGVVRTPLSGSPARYRNSALWLDRNGATVDATDKVVGVPLVESAFDFPGSGGLQAALGQPANGLRLAPARRAKTLHHGGLSLVPLFCFEVIYPGLAERRREPDSMALVNLANDSWFHSSIVSRHQLTIASFRAIEQRLPLLRVAHGGISGVIDPLGRITETIPFDTTGALGVRLMPSEPPRAVEKLALTALLLGGALMGWLAGRAFSRWTPWHDRSYRT